MAAHPRPSLLNGIGVGLICGTEHVDDVEVYSALGRGTSATEAGWARAHAQNKEGLAQLQIGPTSIVVSVVGFPLSPVSLLYCHRAVVAIQ